MHKIPVAAAVVVALSAVAVSALTLRKPMLYSEAPARAHHMLGPVSVSTDARPAGASWSALQTPLLLDDAHVERAVDDDERHDDDPAPAVLAPRPRVVAPRGHTVRQRAVAGVRERELGELGRLAPVHHDLPAPIGLAVMGDGDEHGGRRRAPAHSLASPRAKIDAT